MNLHHATSSTVSTSRDGSSHAAVEPESGNGSSRIGHRSRGLRPQLQRVWKRFANRVVRNASALPETVRAQLPPALESARGIGGRFDPQKAMRGVVFSPAPDGSRPDGAGIEVPPPTLWRNGERSAEEYVEAGRRDMATMREMLAAAGRPIESARTILDFGCAAGRMTRWLLDLAPGREIWGVDINEPSINWCAAHLRPPCHFTVTTTLPHLPFADGTFDVVSAGSVLSIMPELRDPWLLELRRVLSRDGALYMTLPDRHSLDEILSYPEGHRYESLSEVVRKAEQDVGLRKRDWATATILQQQGSSAHVFYDVDHFCTIWSPFFDVREIRNNAYVFETGLVLTPR
jgi:SAM-dependent methyltransferase